jgi:hypothetical protein
MNTYEQLTTERTDTDEPTLTDAGSGTDGEATPTVSAVDVAARQFATDRTDRLPNLVDAENRAMF